MRVYHTLLSQIIAAVTKTSGLAGSSRCIKLRASQKQWAAEQDEIKKIEGSRIPSDMVVGRRRVCSPQVFANGRAGINVRRLFHVAATKLKRSHFSAC